MSSNVNVSVNVSIRNKGETIQLDRQKQKELECGLAYSKLASHLTPGSLMMFVSMLVIDY